jgi:hypothetical protein
VAVSHKLWLLAACLALVLGCDEQRLEGSSAGECSDGADNDADGTYDCEDSDCVGAPVCLGDDDDAGDDDAGDDDTGDDDTGDDDTGDDDTNGDDDTGGPLDGAVYLGDLSFSSDAEMLSFCDSWDTVAGNVMVAGSSVTSLSSLDCLVRVAGLFEVTGTEILDLELPALQEVGGDLVIYDNYPLGGIELLALRGVGGHLLVEEHPWLDELRLPDLQTVTGDLKLRYAGSLQQLSLPSLEGVGGSLWLRYLDALEGLNLGSLATVASDLWVGGNPLLAQLSLPELTVVDAEVMVSANPLLQQMALPRLTEAGGIRITSNPALDDLQLPLLREMLGLPGSLRMSNCAQVAVLSLPSIEFIGDFLMLAGNEGLSQLDMGLLEFVGGDFYITDNLSLPSSQAEALRDSVGTGNIGGDIVISGNGSS